MLSCGVDVGGTKILGLVLDPEHEGAAVVEARVATPRGADAVVAAVAAMARRLGLAANDITGQEVGALGLGVPGLVDRDGVLRFAPNLPGVVDFAFARPLQEQLGLPVVVDNDATCAAWGEHERGAARGRNHTLLVTLGTGIGAGVVVKGQVLRGANGFAGEPGHMVVDPNGPACPCGRRGCWERYGSGSGLGMLARQAALAHRADRMVVLAGGDPEDVRGEHVTAAATEGDPQAGAVLVEFGRWVGLGLANLVNILDSEVIVIGGGLVESGELVLRPIRTALQELVLAGSHRPEVPVLAAELGERAGAVGAALLAAART